MLRGKLNLNQWREKWDQFWFTKYPPHLVAVFRIFFALVLLYRISSYFQFDKPLLWEPRSEDRYFGYLFHIPYFEWLRAPSYEAFQFLINVRTLLLVALFIGLLSQFSAFFIGAISIYIFMLDENFFFHHLYYLCLSALFCGLMPCGKWLSLDRLIGRYTGEPPDQLVSFWGVRLMQVTLSFLYFFTALAKTTPEWLAGHGISLSYEFGLINPKGIVEPLRLVPHVVLAWYTVLIEYFLVFALWFRKTRLIGIILGTSFHLVMDMAMPISSFSQQVIVTYLLFLDPNYFYEQIERLKSKLIPSPNDQKKSA